MLNTYLFIWNLKARKDWTVKLFWEKKSGIFSTCSRTNDINNSLCYAWKQHFSWLAAV